MSSGFGLVVHFNLRDEGSVAGFDELVETTIRGIKLNEPGTLAYVVHSVPNEPLVRVFYELYADRAAFDAHEQQAHTQHFLAQRGLFVGSHDVTFLQVEVGKAPMLP